MLEPEDWPLGLSQHFSYDIFVRNTCDTFVFPHIPLEAGSFAEFSPKHPHSFLEAATTVASFWAHKTPPFSPSAMAAGRYFHFFISIF